MKHLLYPALCLIAAVYCGIGESRLQRSPEFGKYDAEFDKVFQEVSENEGSAELHSLMVLQGGKIIYEKYDISHDRDELHILWSASKTFTSTAIGFAVQDSLLTVNDKVISFFTQEELPAEPSEWLQALTVKDLLIMSSGFGRDYIGYIRAKSLANADSLILNTPLIFEPGSRFKYNSCNTYMLSAIISRVTGMTTEDYLAKKLFAPLGIKRYIWEKSAEGYTSGGWGLYLTTESMAKMGQFYLQKGVWNGKRLLAEEWFDEATRPQIYQPDKDGYTVEQIPAYIDDDWKSGYGYQIWVCTHNAYRLDGARGQLVIVIPDKDAVVVTTAQVVKTKPQMVKSIWNHIYDNI